MQVSFEKRKAAARVFGTNDTSMRRCVAAVLGSTSPTKGLSAETEVSFAERKTAARVFATNNAATRDGEN